MIAKVRRLLEKLPTGIIFLLSVLVLVVAGVGALWAMMLLVSKDVNDIRLGWCLIAFLPVAAWLEWLFLSVSDGVQSAKDKLARER